MKYYGNIFKFSLILQLIVGSIFIGCTMGTEASAASIYYISPSGSDSNDGKSLNSPWETIGKANSTLQLGDMVYIRGGTYREAIIPVNSGGSTERITYSNYNGEPVTITETNYGIHLYQKSYIA